MRYFIIILFFLLANTDCAKSQNIDSTTVAPTTQVKSYRKIYYTDSATLARKKFIKDSIRIAQDSIAISIIKSPLPNRPNRFVDSLLKIYLVKDKYLIPSGYKNIIRNAKFGNSVLKVKKDKWELGLVALIILSAALLYKMFSQEFYLLITGLFNFNPSKQVKKEDNLLFSWQPIVLYILFSASFALLIYQVLKFLGNTYIVKGVYLYMYIFLFILLFYALKLIVLQIVGYVFNFQNMIKDYLKQLQLSCFSTLIILVPLVLILSLIGSTYFLVNVYVSVFFIVLIYILRYLKFIIFYLPNYSFSKTYLILYICTLEICPLFFIIRALNIA